MVSPNDHVVMNHQNQTRTNGIWGHVRYMDAAGESGSILAWWSGDGEVWKVTRRFQQWGGLQSNRSWAAVALGAFYCSEMPGKWRDRKQSVGKVGRQCRHRVRLTPIILHRKRLTNGAHHEGSTHKLHTKGMWSAVGWFLLQRGA
jgi:hypothetical protein